MLNTRTRDSAICRKWIPPLFDLLFYRHGRTYRRSLFGNVFEEVSSFRTKADEPLRASFIRHV